MNTHPHYQSETAAQLHAEGMARCVRSVKKMEVIRVESLRGQGEADNPVRLILQYWSLGGELLAERDPWPLDLG